MNKTIVISFVLTLYCSLLFAQNNLNSYKYILVPTQFEFQKSEDQYQLNSLTKFLFKKEGYTVLFAKENYPIDLATNSCLALKVRVTSNPSLFKTKIKINLYDCYNKIIYTTKEGISKEKDFKRAYQEAIRNAFYELKEFKYVYDTSSIKNNKMETTVKKIVATPKVVQIPKTEKVKKIKTDAKVPISENNVPKAAAEITVKKESEDVKIASIKIGTNSIVSKLEGKFYFDNWGVSTISAKADRFSVVGGDENFEFATIYKTSKPTTYIIKWVAFKKPQLIEIDSEGNLNVDTDKGVKFYKRVD